MASFKTTIKSTLNAATTTVDAAAKYVSAIAISADMLDAFMKAELHDQQIGYKLNAGKRAAEQVIEAKQAIAQLQVDAAAFIKKSAEHGEAYKSASTYIDSIVEELGIKNMPNIKVE